MDTPMDHTLSNLFHSLTRPLTEVHPLNLFLMTRSAASATSNWGREFRVRPVLKILVMREKRDCIAFRSSVPGRDALYLHRKRPYRAPLSPMACDLCTHFSNLKSGPSILVSRVLTAFSTNTKEIAANVVAVWRYNLIHTPSRFPGRALVKEVIFILICCSSDLPLDTDCLSRFPIAGSCFAGFDGLRDSEAATDPLVDRSCCAESDCVRSRFVVSNAALSISTAYFD